MDQGYVLVLLLLLLLDDSGDQMGPGARCSHRVVTVGLFIVRHTGDTLVTCSDR